MSVHGATIRWMRAGDAFADGRYHRTHLWEFDGGIRLHASSSPAVVPLPMSAADAVDPEEAFVAALASCHMLWFLSIAQWNGHVVEAYEDSARGLIGQDGEGRTAMIEIRLAPRVAFAGSAPDEATFRALHEEAHRRCFLAASVVSAIRCEPQIVG